MRFFFILFLLFLSSCQKDSLKVTGKYYPNQYRPELNLSESSILTASSSTLQSGDQIQVSLFSVDSNNQAVNYGGGKVTFFISESENAGSFSPVIDDNSGTYTSVYTAKTSGSFTLKAKVNYSKKSVTIGSVPLSVSIGALSVLNSNISFNKTLMRVGDSLVFTLTLKDSGGNLYDDPNLFINPTLLDGTSLGTFNGVNYIGNAQYQGTFTATGSGTATHINLSVRYQGSVYSVQTIEVVP